MQSLLDTFCEGIDEVLSRLDAPSQDFLLSSVRGLTMLLLLPDIDCSTQHFERVVQQLKHCHDHLRMNPEKEGEFKYDELPVKLIEKCLPKDIILNIVQKFQNYITLVIIQSIFKQDAIQQVIQVLDFFYRANN